MKYLGILIATAAALASASAQARNYTVDEAQSRYISCYNREYVPARVAVNTRGKLVRKASKSWEVTGERWDYVRNQAVYIQTRRVVEPDHYTLVQGSC